MSDYYPPVAFSFVVNLAGHASAEDIGFQEVSGLDTQYQTTEVVEGGENRFVHHLPGPVKHQNIVLKRGIMVAASPLFVWCKEVMEGDLAQPIEPMDLTISLLDTNARPVISWSVNRAWPVKWSVSQLKVGEKKVAIETLELAIHSLKRKIVQSPPT